MLEIKNSARAVTPAELPKLSLFTQQKFQTESDFTRLSEEFKRRKTHLIFRCLIALLRGERVEPIEGFCTFTFNVPKLNYSRNFGLLETEELFKLGVCSIPNFILNALVCEKLSKYFGDLSICGCFIKIGSNWRLDIDERLSLRGLFLPVRSYQSNLIYGLKVFRYPDDQKPFLLKLRMVPEYE